jgi:hypothetical protein
VEVWGNGVLEEPWITEIMVQGADLGAILLIQYGNASVFSFLNLISLNLINSWNLDASGDLRFQGRIWRVLASVKLYQPALKAERGIFSQHPAPDQYPPQRRRHTLWV